MKQIIVSVLLLFCLNLLASEPISDVTDHPGQDSYQKVAAKSGFSNGLELKSEKDALLYFKKDYLKKIGIDFTKQKLVIFAWSGSGGDRITYGVLESYPEQIRFNFNRGRTKDLRRHYKAFIIRNNVSWR